MFKNNISIPEKKDADAATLSPGIENYLISHENKNKMLQRKEGSDESMHMERCGRA